MGAGVHGDGVDGEWKGRGVQDGGMVEVDSSLVCCPEGRCCCNAPRITRWDMVVCCPNVL